MLLLAELRIQIISLRFQLSDLHSKLSFLVQNWQFSIGDHNRLLVVYRDSLAVDEVPVIFADFDIFGLLVLIGSIVDTEYNNLYFLTEQFQQIKGSWLRRCQSLILTLAMLIFFLTQEEHLAVEFIVTQMTHWKFIQLNEFIKLFVHLDIDLILFLCQYHQHVRTGLDQLQRHTPDEEPKRYDFMHAVLVVDFDSGLLVPNNETALVINADVG